MKKSCQSLHDYVSKCNQSVNAEKKDSHLKVVQQV